MPGDLDAELEAAVARLRADPRVDLASLGERIARIKSQRGRGEDAYAHDLGAELRLAAHRLLGAQGIERLAFSESPDLQLVVAGAGVSIEVRRFRSTPRDRELDQKLAQAGREGRLVAYSGAPEQETAKQRILKKLRGMKPLPGSIVIVVSDSDHEFETDVVAYGAREAITELYLAREPVPVGAIAAWQPGWSTEFLIARGATSLLIPAARGLLESLPRARFL